MTETVSASLRRRRLDRLGEITARLDHVAEHLPHLPGRRQATADAEAIRWALAQLDPGDTAA